MTNLCPETVGILSTSNELLFIVGNGCFFPKPIRVVFVNRIKPNPNLPL